MVAIYYDECYAWLMVLCYDGMVVMCLCDDTMEWFSHMVVITEMKENAGEKVEVVKEEARKKACETMECR